MLKLNYEFDRSIFDRASKQVNDSPKLMQRALKREEGRLRSRVLKVVKVEPPVFRGKRRWTSERQRRAYFATNGFGAGIPYQRTHQLTNSWDAKFKFDETGGAFEVENTSPVATYVIGLDQQIMHADSGWIYAPAYVDEFATLALDVYEQTWITVADPFAGVPR